MQRPRFNNAWTIVMIILAAVAIGIIVFVHFRTEYEINNNPEVIAARAAREEAESRLQEAKEFNARIEQHSKEYEDRIKEIDEEMAWLNYCIDELYKLNDKETLTENDKWWMDFYLSELQKAGVVTEINRK